MICLPSDLHSADGFIAADDMITMGLQSATQWDSLAHVGYDNMFYNGVPAAAVNNFTRASKNSFDKLNDRLITRGVLLDIARLKGVDRLEGGYEITIDDLNAAEKRQGVTVESGDVLLLRTGHHKWFAEGDRARCMGAEAGPGLESCRWFHQREIAALAVDNPSCEVQPAKIEGAAVPFHQTAIRDIGLLIGEMFDLEALGEDCESDGIYEFLFAGHRPEGHQLSRLARHPYGHQMSAPITYWPTESKMLPGKTALITAAASGMGRAGARLFAAHGAHVILVDVDQAGCEQVAAEIIGHGGSAEAHGVDLGDRAATDRFLDRVIAERDVLDVLYNHVGITGPFGLDFDAAAWDQCLTINLWAPTVFTQRLVPLLKRSTSASIIFTASQAGLVGTANLPVYAATKGAVIQFMKSVALLYAGDGIRANAICPGLTNTAGVTTVFPPDQIEASLAAFAKTVPNGRVAEPEEMASVALFLASEASRYITGIAVPVDGGATTGHRV